MNDIPCLVNCVRKPSADPLREGGKKSSTKIDIDAEKEAT
jgi:hypothetical protein